jgi:hypothetical protein
MGMAHKLGSILQNLAQAIFNVVAKKLEDVLARRSHSSSLCI